MLSQRLGFHYGDNVALDGTGTYTVDVETAPTNLRLARGLGDVDGSARFTFEFDYDPAALSALAFERPVDAGQRGALPARTADDVPLARVPPVDALPGESLGTQSLGDAEIAVTLLENELADGSTYVAVSPRTPHRRYPLPFMTLFGTLSGGGFDDVLSPTLDPGLGYHYGARLDSADASARFVVGVGVPPQVARHEGYETAFMTTDPLEFDFK